MTTQSLATAPTEPPSAPTWMVCERCQEARASGDLATALACPYCKGRGIRRTRESYRCNQCGGCLCPDVQDSWNRHSPDGLIEVRVRGHYDSTDLCDTTVYEFSICEGCLRRMFNSFVVPPRMGEYMLNGSGEEIMGDDPQAYAKDRDCQETYLWRKANGHVQKFGDGLCNETRACPNKASWRKLLHGSITWDVCCDEHRPKEGLSHSYNYVPIALLTGMSGDEEALDVGQRMRVVRCWLALTRRTTPVTIYRYVTHDVAILVGDATYHSGQHPIHPHPWMAWVTGPETGETYRQAMRMVDHDKMLSEIDFQAEELALNEVLGGFGSNPRDTRGTLLVAFEESVLRPLLATSAPIGAIEF